MESLFGLVTLLIAGVVLLASHSLPTLHINYQLKVEEIDRTMTKANHEIRRSRRDLLRAFGLKEGESLFSPNFKFLTPPPLPSSPRFRPRSSPPDPLDAPPLFDDIMRVPSHISKRKSARLLWLLDEFLPSHPNIDGCTPGGRAILLKIAQADEAERQSKSNRPRKLSSISRWLFSPGPVTVQPGPAVVKSDPAAIPQEPIVPQTPVRPEEPHSPEGETTETIVSPDQNDAPDELSPVPAAPASPKHVTTSPREPSPTPEVANYAPEGAHTQEEEPLSSDAPSMTGTG